MVAKTKKKEEMPNLSKAVKFFKGLKAGQKVAIVHHDDMDGSCSAALTAKFLTALQVQSIARATSIEDAQKTIDELPEYDKLIVLDLALTKIVSKKPVLHVDHHPTFKSLNSRNIVQVNPALRHGPYQPTPYILMKIFNSYGITLKEYEWLAVLGIVADYGYDDCKDLLDEWISVDNRDEIWETQFGKLAKMIGGGALELGWDNVREIISTAKELEDLETNEKVVSAHKEYMREYFRCKSQALRSIEKFGRVQFVRAFSKYRGLASHIGMELSMENPRAIFLIYEKRDGKIKISARSHAQGVDLGEAMKKATKGIGSGGGHPPAAGALVDESKFDIFKQRVLEMLR